MQLTRSRLIMVLNEGEEEDEMFSYYNHERMDTRDWTLDPYQYYQYSH